MAISQPTIMIEAGLRRVALNSSTEDSVCARIWGVIYAALLAGSASAQTLNTDDFVFANQAAQVIGRADACGYLDDEKLTAFMAKIADLDATSRMFTNARGIQARVINSMIETEKKDQCAPQAKMAQKYGISR